MLPFGQKIIKAIMHLAINAKSNGIRPRHIVIAKKMIDHLSIRTKDILKAISDFSLSSIISEINQGVPINANKKVTNDKNCHGLLIKNPLRLTLPNL